MPIFSSAPLSKSEPKRSPRIQPYLNLSTIQTLVIYPPSCRAPTRPVPLGPKPTLFLSRTGNDFIPLPLQTVILKAPRNPSARLDKSESILEIVNPKTWRLEGPEPRDELSPRLKLMKPELKGWYFTEEWDRLQEVIFTGESVLDNPELRKSMRRSSSLRSSKGTLEYTLVSKHRSSPDSVVKFGADALEDQLELAGRVAGRRKQGDEVVGASLTLRVVQG